MQANIWAHKLGLDFMYCRRLLFFGVLLLTGWLPSISSAAITNKGLICESETYNEALPITKYTGFWFSTPNNYEWWRPDTIDENQNGDKAEFLILFGSSSTVYKLSSDHVFLYLKKFPTDEPSYGMYVQVDRYDLTATQHYKDRKYNYKCSVKKDLVEFRKELKEISRRFPRFEAPKIRKKKF